MNIVDRFSSHLREVLAKSIRLATGLKSPMVEPIHLFFSLSNEKGSVAAEILNKLKCDPKTLEQAIINLSEKKYVKAANESNTAQAVFSTFSETSKNALEKAMLVAEENQHNYIGTEHLLSALLSLSDPVINTLFKINNVDIKEIGAQTETVLANASQFPRVTEVAEVADRIQENIQDQLIGEVPMMPPLQTKKGKRQESALDFFAANLTSKEVQKSIDPVIGRDNEIERMIHILCRRTKNNPILLGEPGVGKTAIVEGLAKKISEGDVPDILLNKKIYAIDMGLLIAGTIYRGEFEARLRQVMEETAHNPNIILFIDELHNIIGAGSNQGTMDAANILKPVLARGQLRCIGATTPQEFKKYIESDAALERRFQPINVKESSVEDTIKILAGIKKNYEAYHNLNIEQDALEAAAKLSDRYISNKFLPDKAIDLLDETSAAVRLRTKQPLLETKLWKLTQKLESVTQEKENAAINDQFDKAVKLKEKETQIKEDIKKFKKNRGDKKIKVLGKVTARDVAEELSKILGNTPTDLVLDEKDRLLKIENDLKEYIVGQDSVLKEVSELIRQAQLGLSHPNRPLASFLFVGESGVGKTELAKTIASVLYPGQDALITLNMSEFHEGHSASKLLGSPAGYIGYKDTNQFTDRIKMHPYSVILFDEIDKAHRDVSKLLLQMLENGEINDASGKKISLRHTIIILTTTFGADAAKKSLIGFGGKQTEEKEIFARTAEALKTHFTPELINRLDKICLFNTLTKIDLVKIAELEIKELNSRLDRYHTFVKTDNKILAWLISQLNNKISARDVRQKIRSDVERLMAEVILNSKVKKEYELVVKDGAISMVSS